MSPAIVSVIGLRPPTNQIRWWAVIFFAICSVSSSAISQSASENSAMYWKKQCLDPAPLECVVYLKGVLDLHSMLQHYFKTPLWCAPQQVGVEQTRLIVNDFLSKHPESLHSPFVGLIAVAMKTKFPCPDAPTQPR